MKNAVSLFLIFLISCSHGPQISPSQPELTLSKVDLRPSQSRDQHESFADRSMISTQGKATTAAAIEILKKGGNLFDAFTAASFAISVERPHSTGLGGGGFVLFHDAQSGETKSLDFREMAPQQAHSDMFLDPAGNPIPEKSLTGALAVAVPGHVAGVLELHKLKGRLKLEEVLAPAIRLAENGFPVYPALAEVMASSKEQLKRFPDSRKIFLNPLGEPWPVGHQLVQKDLARTLKLIAKSGSHAFYSGEIAKKIAGSIQRHGGILNENDLKKYRTVWRAPVQGTFKGYEIYSQAPPSSGGMHVLQILNILEKDPLKTWGPQSAKSVHITASAMQRAFFDRARHAGDPDFSNIPVAQLISKDYAASLRSQIRIDQAVPAAQFKLKEESPETTHMSLMDSAGNAIVSTQTINGFFGSALVAEGTGIVLNNEMDDFAAKVGASNLFGAIGGRNNLIQPGKRPVSSMSPTLVLKDQRPYLAVGTPSGTRIITCVALTVLNVIEYQMPLWDAVSLVRYHQQWQPDELQIENPLLPSSTVSELQKLGWKTQTKDGRCRIQAIQFDQGRLHGVSDPREEGSSQGL